MQRYTVYLYLETALHVSGATSTHHQEHIHLYLHHLVFVTPLLLSAAIVEELEPVWVCCGWHRPPTPHSNLILSMHVPINFKSPNNIIKWQMRFNSAFKGLIWVLRQSNASFSVTIFNTLCKRYVTINETTAILPAYYPLILPPATFS
jgi:hypothetical protein